MVGLRDWLVYNEQFDLLICVPCGVVIMPGKLGGVKGHLEYSHHLNVERFALTKSERHELLQLHGQRVLNPRPFHPGPNSAPIPYLPVIDGFYYMDCPHICTTHGSIEYHSRHKHRWSSKNNGNLPLLFILPVSSLSYSS
jgi:Orsellinic acid/F9775 biosynthesis cluster protein D